MKKTNVTERRITKDKIMVFVINNKVFLILLVMIIAAQFLSNGLFFTYRNLSSVSRQIAVTTIVALGYAVLLSSGSMDLSSGEIVGMVGIIYASLSSVSMPLAIIAALVVGAVAGFINGLIMIKFKLSAIVVTLATAQIFKAIAALLCGGKSIGDLSDSVKYLGQGLIFSIPISFIFVIIIMIIIAIIMGRTKIGRHILATGGNVEAARVSGINTFAVKSISFIILGLCCAVGAIVLTGRVAVAEPTAASSLVLDCIAAVVIGGTYMKGGKAKIIGTIAGCLIMGVISNVLNLTNVSPFYQWAAKGAVILIAVILDSRTEVFFNERRRRMAS